MDTAKDLRFLKEIVVICFLILSPFSLYALGEDDNDQDEESSPKFYAGGNLGLQFGTVTLVDVSPWLSYRIIDRFSVGVGGSYKYYRFDNQFLNNQNTNPSHTYHYYGGRLFSRYYPQSESIGVLNAIFLHAEYEILEFQLSDNSNQRVKSIFGGAGYQIPLGEHVYGDIYLLYDFKKSGYSPYKNPLLRFGVKVGL
ncbi:MAG: hypothetical protein K9I74_12135 [Bacteroidales bacterium]|nr:hypothetical protein [Bacteroidales bacterium]